MKNGQTGKTQIGGLCVLVELQEQPRNDVFIISQSENSLWFTVDCGGGRWYISIDRRSLWGAASGYSHLGEESCQWYVLYLLSTFILRPGEDFTIPMYLRHCDLIALPMPTNIHFPRISSTLHKWIFL